MEAKESKFNITDRIRDIRKAREELRRAVRNESICCTPMLTDYSIVPKLYKMYRELTGDVSELDIDVRRMFIFIVQYFYAPRNLFGGKMPSGLRRVLANTMGVKAHSIVSRGAFETGPRYLIYSEFRQKVNDVFEKITDLMQKDGII